MVKLELKITTQKPNVKFEGPFYSSLNDSTNCKEAKDVIFKSRFRNKSNSLKVLVSCSVFHKKGRLLALRARISTEILPYKGEIL